MFIYQILLKLLVSDSLMTSLADFVNEQRSRSSGVFSGIRESVSVGDFRSKMSNSISSLFSRGDADDQELLTDSASTTGQLPSSRNRWVYISELKSMCKLPFLEKREDGSALERMPMSVDYPGSRELSCFSYYFPWQLSVSDPRWCCYQS